MPYSTPASYRIRSTGQRALNSEGAGHAAAQILTSLRRGLDDKVVQHVPHTLELGDWRWPVRFNYEHVELKRYVTFPENTYYWPKSLGRPVIQMLDSSRNYETPKRHEEDEE